MQKFKQSQTTGVYTRIYMFLANVSDGYTPVTSLVSATVNLFKNGVAFGSQPTTPATLTHIQSGHWYYEMDSSYLSDLGILTVTVQDTNIRPVVLMAEVVTYDPTTSTGITAADVWSYGTRDLTGSVTVGTINANVITATSIASNAITSAKFGDSALVIGSAAAGGVKAYLDAGSITAGVIATNAIDADAIATNAIDSDAIADSAITIRLSTDATASEARLIAGTTASDVWNALVASYATVDTFGARLVRSASASTTNEVTINASNHIAANVHQLQANVITAASIATGAIDADALAADAATEIAVATLTTDISGYVSPTAGYAIYQGLLEAGLAKGFAEQMTFPAYIESHADTLLNRNVGGGSNAGRLVKEALYALRNKSQIIGTTLSVYDASDALSWTATVASSSSADPITGIDP